MELCVFSRAGFVAQATSCWLAVRLEIFSNAIAGLAALLVVLTTAEEAGGAAAAMAGLALTLAPSLTENLNQLLKQVSFIYIHIFRYR